MITVVIGVEAIDGDPYARFVATANLMNYVSQNFVPSLIVSKGEAYNNSKSTVHDGKKTNATAVAKDDFIVIERQGSQAEAKITFKIVLPQAIRFIIPSLISQLVVVVKDTTVAYVVSYPDLMQNARVLITNYDALVSVYLVIAVIYILINVAINKAAVYVSHKTGATIIR